MERAFTQFAVEDGVATLRMNRPEKLNAFHGEMLDEMRDALDRVATDGTIRVLILTGSGRAFSTGADLSWFRPEMPGYDFRVMARRTTAFFDELETVEKPVIAAINGLCVGGGLEMALSADLRIAADDARFGLTETRAGIIPGSGGCSRLVKLIGAGKTKELIFLADLIDAPEAHRIGLVNAVVPPDRLEETAREWARRIMTRGPLAVGVAKRVINKSLDVDGATGRVLEHFGQSILLATEDAREGFAAFAGKRAPRFEAR